MNVNEQLVEHLYKKIGNLSDIVKFSKENTFYYSIAYLLGYDIEKQFYYKANKYLYEIYFKSLGEIRDSFTKMKIKAIFFKGITLANRLYDKPQKRYIGDIDIFVNKKDFPKALMQLIKLGYVFRDENTYYSEFHIVLIRDNVTVELHKNIFHPRIEINEDFFIDNSEICEISEHTIMTFNTTATLLHLIYHLYMDYCIINTNFYHVLIVKDLPKAKRFLYRAYEISLYSEKYFDKINWQEIEEDIQRQKFRIVFKKMILDILEIFPMAFPQSMVDIVCQLSFLDDDRDELYKYWIKSNINDKCGGDADNWLSMYIDDNWNKRKEKNLFMKLGETTSIVANERNSTELNLKCDICAKKNANGLKIVFKVSSDDFCISELNNYNTQMSDGVHLLLCGTEKYSYNSIFFFPKEIDDKIKIVACDVLGGEPKVLDEKLIYAKFLKSKDFYTITAVLSNEFLNENKLNSYFYMGIIVSDCSSETHYRKNQLTLTKEKNERYNPIYFAKIHLK